MKCGEDALAVGDAVEREIDGTWYPAEVEEVVSRGLVSLVYVDDGNRERDVPLQEVRRREREGGAGEQVSYMHGTAAARQNGDKETKDDEGVKRKDYHESRGGSTVTLGREEGAATAYIINGAETNIAAGSGLRALRWLRS